MNHGNQKFMFFLLWGVLWYLWNASLIFLAIFIEIFRRSRSPKKAKGETGTPKETKAKSTPEIEQVGCGLSHVSMMT